MVYGAVPDEKPNLRRCVEKACGRSRRMKFTLEGAWEPRAANFMRLDLPHAF
jgi:hypothetical protein